MAEKTPMTPEAAQRIQSHADKTGTNQDFKGRAASAAAQNSAGPPQQPASGQSGSKSTSGKK